MRISDWSSDVCSSDLRIMAGLDAEFNGEAWAADGSTVGFLPQEPQLDPAKTVEENVLEALGAEKAVVDEFAAVSGKPAEVTDPDEMTALIARQAQLQETIGAEEAEKSDGGGE